MARGHHGDAFPVGGELHELRHGEKQGRLINTSKLVSEITQITGRTQ